MIPDKYAELLNLPPATPVEEAQRHCQQLLERLRQNIDSLPQAHQIQPDLDSRKTELEQALAFFEEQSQSALEQTLDQGMACLMQQPPDYAGAGKFYAAAERAAAGKTIPDLLKRRMQVFKQTLEELKAKVLRGKISDTLKRIASLLAQEPPGITEAREKLGLVASALRQAPDPAMRAEFENLRKIFQEREKQMGHARIEAARPVPVETPAAPPPPAANAVKQGANEKSNPAAQQAPAAPPAPKPIEPVEPEAGHSLTADTHSPVPPAAAQRPLENSKEMPAGAATTTAEKPTPPSEPAPAKTPPVKAIPMVRSVAVEPPGRFKKLVPVIAAILILAVIGIIYAGYVKIKSARPAATVHQDIGQVAEQTSAPAVALPPTNVTPPLPVTNPAVTSTPVAQPPARPVPPPEFGELTISVTPDGADLFTNGVSLGHPHYPVVLRGVSQGEIALRATLEGYVSDSITLVFPSHGAQMRQTFELQPKLAVLLVQSEPASKEVLLQRPGGRAVRVKSPREGIGFTPGVPVNVAIELPGYEPMTVQVPALKPGERHEVAFGRLKPQGGKLRLKVDPPDARFTISYPGRDPIHCGAVPVIEGILPDVEFRVIAERAGYAPQSSRFTFEEREVRDFDFGRLKPLSGTLLVSASPQPFELKVAWDGLTRDYGASGKAAELPVKKNLAVSVSATGRETLSTNLTLEAGETRQVIFGPLEALRENIVIKTDTDAAEVIYSLDKGAPVALSVTNRIAGVPFGSALTVTLHKAGYVDRTLEIKKAARPSETLDFGRLMPVTVTAVSAADVEQTLRDTTAGIDAVKARLPLTDASRHNWIDWIKQIETRYKDDAQAWARLNGPIEQLRELVNTTRPLQRVPVIGSSMEP